MNRKNLTDEQLGQLLREWQQHLRLVDWRVTASIARGHDVGEGLAGMINYCSQHKNATIKLLDVVDSSPEDVNDQEFYLVHELLHLHFAHFMPDRDRHGEVVFDSAELAINSMAGALVELKRCTRRLQAKEKSN